MKVQEFCKIYKSTTNVQTKSAQIEKIISTKYVPIADKIAIIEGLVKGLFKPSNGTMLTCNSITKYLSFTMIIVQTYTTLETDDLHKDYDVLVETGVLSKILEAIETDYSDIQNLFNLRFSDIMQEQNSIEALIHNNTYELVNKIGNSVETVTAKINGYIETLDEGKIEKILKLTKLINR